MHLTGGIIDYLIVFFGGVLVSFTPCVYPLMPVSVAYIAGVNVKGSRWGGFWLSILYVFGVAISYSILAILAVMTGKVFGAIQQNPWIYLAVANVMLFFALVMLDVIPLPMLRLAQDGSKPKTWLSVMGFGMVSGLVIGPCTAPALGSLLIYVASKQNIVFGISLLFVFAYGLGASLILAGTFSGFLSSLPKSGIWMDRIKKFAGVVFIIAAEVYFIRAGSLF
ncbi:MAG: sulfite exporter TauE/SafE family protein [Candidatus Omnitrophica bacterium]|nr:sulfite exporter TauE/SafE family protein [Candidatus Omnitrophota bacterium]